MRLNLLIGILVGLSVPSVSLETTLDRRIHRHKHAKAVKAKPLESLSQLLARSAELTKAFEKESADLHNQVQETEEVDSDAASFVETSRPNRPTGAGLRAMESVTNEIMQFTDKMRKMGNEVSLFASR